MQEIRGRCEVASAWEKFKCWSRSPSAAVLLLPPIPVLSARTSYDSRKNRNVQSNRIPACKVDKRKR